MTFNDTSLSAIPKASIASHPFANDFPPPSIDKAQAVVESEALAKRLVRFEIVDPQVQVDGSILGSGKILYLYGIKTFSSKNLCTRASGERWACGLHAYATLRNTIAKKTIVCDPKTLLPNAVAAICRVGTTNVALALVRDGLVELDESVDDAEMASAQTLAKTGKLGIWDR